MRCLKRNKLRFIKLFTELFIDLKRNELPPQIH